MANKVELYNSGVLIGTDNAPVVTGSNWSYSIPYTADAGNDVLTAKAFIDNVEVASSGVRNVTINAAPPAGEEETVLWRTYPNAADAGDGTGTLVGTAGGHYGSKPTKNTLVKADGNYVETTLPTSSSEILATIISLHSTDSDDFSVSSGYSITKGALAAVFFASGKCYAQADGATAFDMGSFAAGKIMRLRISGSDVIASYDGIDKKTFVGAAAGNLFIKGALGTVGGTKIYNVKTKGAVAA